MKFNKWTLGLAAVGAVSMASAVRADDAPKLNALNTALSSTTISGYVDVAAQYNLGNPGGTLANPLVHVVGNTAKVDQFSVNDADITLDKPLDESPWASGYHIELNWGQDVGLWGDGNLRQAYVTVRTPVGNGIDWKIGEFDGVTGYESNTSWLNPNYTRSYGYAVNPATETGIIGAYKICNEVSVQLGLVNRASGASVGLSSKDYIGTLALTAPDSWGWLKGSTLNFGTVQTFDNGGVNNYSVSGTFATPVAGLKFGLAYDKVQGLGYFGNQTDGNIYGVYVTYQATDKLNFSARGEYVDGQNLGIFAPANDTGLGGGKGEEVTLTVEYDLWANVVSRLEGRWDHTESGTQYGINTGDENAFLVALNLVYKF